MKTANLVPIALPIAVSCSQPGQTDAKATDTKAGEIAADTRPDRSVIDRSKPTDHSEADADAVPIDHGATMTSQSSDSAATKGNKQSMSRMMQGMPPYTGDAGIDFNKQMRVYHLAAIDMADVQIVQGSNPETKVPA